MWIFSVMSLKSEGYQRSQLIYAYPHKYVTFYYLEIWSCCLMALNTIHMLMTLHFFISSTPAPLNSGRMTPSESSTISIEYLLGNAYFKSPEPNSGYPPQLFLLQPPPSQWTATPVFQVLSQNTRSHLWPPLLHTPYSHPQAFFAGYIYIFKLHSEFRHLSSCYQWLSLQSELLIIVFLDYCHNLLTNVLAFNLAPVFYTQKAKVSNVLSLLKASQWLPIFKCFHGVLVCLDCCNKNH